MTSSVTAEHVDTCFPDYLQDGHTRDGEWLALTHLSGQTVDEAAQELLDMINGEAPPEDFPEDIDDAAILAAFRDALQGADLRAVDRNGNKIDSNVDHEEVPEDHPVQPIDEPTGAAHEATCRTCDRTWDDSTPTSMTPTPSGRCPFEDYHAPEAAEEQPCVYVVLRWEKDEGDE